MKTTVIRNSLLKGLICLPLLLLISCSEDSSKVEATYSSLWDNRFSSCGVTCHSDIADDGTQLGPFLVTRAGFYDNLFNKSVAVNYPAWLAQKSGNCNTQKFIAPGNANTSTLAASLIQSVSNTLKANTGCDSSYNLHVANNVEITDKDLENALINWINSGAPNN